MTFFDKHTEKFDDAEIIDGKLQAKPFLVAAQVLVTLLGATFAPVKSDIQGNINKLMDTVKKYPTESETFQDIVYRERREKQNSATDALLWLKRALEFTCLALRTNLKSATEELSASFTKAYHSTLSKHHSFLIRPVFSLAMNACPSRANFYANLAEGEMDKLLKQLDAWISGLESRLRVIVEFYISEKLA